ncbi:MAG: amidohydrolase family protein [Ginsengibacter sp.]
MKKNYSRRDFMANASIFLAGTSLKLNGLAGIVESKKEPIIDIHQHIYYNARTDEEMLAHQRAMGITTTFLLPSGRPVSALSAYKDLPDGFQSKFGRVGGNAESYLFAKQHKKDFRFGVSAVPDLPNALPEIEKYLKLGAVIIGELKYSVECDSPDMQKIYQLAENYNVPVLMHWQYKMYNYGFERFDKMLQKYPKVNFIGHAQTWWANIDKKHTDQSVLYPDGPVTAGGITDRYLSDYPNMYGDLSAGSGLNALTRDEDHARLFLERHQDKLVYGSDCDDTSGLASALNCSGALDIAEIRKLVPDKKIQRKLLYENSKKLFRL